MDIITVAKCCCGAGGIGCIFFTIMAMLLDWSIKNSQDEITSQQKESCVQYAWAGMIFFIIGLSILANNYYFRCIEMLK